MDALPAEIWREIYGRDPTYHAVWMRIQALLPKSRPGPEPRWRTPTTGHMVSWELVPRPSGTAWGWACTARDPEESSALTSESVGRPLSDVEKSERMVDYTSRTLVRSFRDGSLCYYHPWRSLPLVPRGLPIEDELRLLRELSVAENRSEAPRLEDARVRVDEVYWRRFAA